MEVVHIRDNSGAKDICSLQVEVSVDLEQEQHLAEEAFDCNHHLVLEHEHLDEVGHFVVEVDLKADPEAEHDQVAVISFEDSDLSQQLKLNT